MEDLRAARLTLLLGSVLLAGCAASEPLGTPSRSEAVRSECAALAKVARDGWHMPWRVRVFGSDADGAALEQQQAAREERLALAQLEELRRLYEETPFDLYATDVVIEGRGAPRAKMNSDGLYLQVRLPAPQGEEAPSAIPAAELLDAQAEGYRWDRKAVWFRGEPREELSLALLRDLGKLEGLAEELEVECRRLELLAGTLLSRRERGEEEALTPSEADFARGAQVRATIAIHRVLNTFARWRYASGDEAFSLRREALTVTVLARLIHERYLDRLLGSIVGGRTTHAVWREDWWSRNPIYKVLDAEGPPLLVGGRELPGRVPQGSIQALLDLRLDDDLRSAFKEVDRAWADRGPRPGDGPLAEALVRAELSLEGHRQEELTLDAFTAWKELWDARLKNTVKVPFYAIVRGVGSFLGATRLTRRAPAISRGQLQQLAKAMRPGDVILVRQDDYLSNAFLPGFWSHALLYLGPREAWAGLKLPDGTPLRQDPMVRERLERFEGAADSGGPARVIEAVSKGVVLSSLDHAVRKDYALVLRPQLPEPALAEAIRCALRFLDQPYDFDFDFASDDRMVCTELVYRALGDEVGLAASRRSEQIPGLVEVMGRLTMPANELARYALYSVEHPEAQPELGYPGRRLSLVALVDRNGEVADYLTGAPAVERLRASVAR